MSSSPSSSLASDPLERSDDRLSHPFRTFRIRYPGSPFAEQTFIEAFLNREGWLPYTKEKDNQESDGPDLLIVPYSSIDWSLVLPSLPFDDTLSPSSLLSSVTSTRYVSSYPIRTAIVRKDKLANLYPLVLQHALSIFHKHDEYSLRVLRNCLPITLDSSSLLSMASASTTISSTEKFLEQQFWIRKEVSTNNALGIHLLSGGDTLALIKKGSLSLPSSTDSIIQQYITTPVLYKQSKFHCRVNVIVFGSNPIAVYIHQDIICHVACEPWSLPMNNTTRNNSIHRIPTEVDISPTDPTFTVSNDTISDSSRAIEHKQQFIHITNHTVQRNHPHYQRKTHTLTLQEIIRSIETDPSLDRSDENQSCNDRSSGKRKSSRLYRRIFNDIRLIIRTIFSTLTPSQNSSSLSMNNENPSFHDLSDPATTTGTTTSIPFVPIPNAFEIYGFDFLLSTAPIRSDGCDSSLYKASFDRSLLSTNGGGTDGSNDPLPATMDRSDPYDSSSTLSTPPIIYPILLEINAGPALEGLAWPLMCRRVIGDIVDLIDQFIPFPPSSSSSSSVNSSCNRCSVDHSTTNDDYTTAKSQQIHTIADSYVSHKGIRYPVPDNDNGFIRIM